MTALVAGASIELLERVALFGDLDEAELHVVADSMQERTFLSGERVTVEGGRGDGFFVVAEGSADVTVEGEPRGTIGPGDHFGEIALLMGAERTATVTATSDFHCFALTPDDFRTLVEGNPTIAWKLLGSTMEKLS